MQNGFQAALDAVIRLYRGQPRSAREAGLPTGKTPPEAELEKLSRFPFLP